MKIKIKNLRDIIAVSDDTKECDSKTAFFLNDLNKKYLKSLDKSVKIMEAKEVASILEIEKIKIIGITGTNGKTTTAAAIYSILLDLGKKVALQGTRGCFINDKQVSPKGLTTPPVLESMLNIHKALKEGCEFFVMEVSSHAIAQNRIEGLNFFLKVFTNVTQDHLDYHKSLEEYIKVKSSFFADESLKLINKDENKITFNPENARTYGIENPATYKILAYSLVDGISAALAKIDKVYDFQTSLHGFFNLYNILAAISSVDMLEVAPMEEICEAVEGFGGVSGRMEIVSSDPLVIVDFAHTPDGMQKVLESMKERDVIVLFGAGGDRDRGKRAKMGFIASKYARKIIVTSDNPRSEEPELIIEDILQGIRKRDNLLVVSDRKEAIRKALEWQEKDEVLMILGKGDESYQEINGKKIPFSDKDTVLKNLQKL